jgi:hypothetical protein
MRRAPQLGQMPRRLQLKASSRSAWHVLQRNPYKFTPVPKYLYYDALNNHLKETKEMGLSHAESARHIIRQGLREIPTELIVGDSWSHGELLGFLG